MPARSRTLISVASPRMTTGPNSSSSRANRSGRCSISVTSWPISSSERVTFAPTLPPPATMMYISCACGRGARTARTVSRRTEIAVWVGHTVSQPALRIERRARGIEDADDDAVRRSVPPLQHLPDDDVRVVAVGGDDRRVRIGDSGPLEHRGVHAVADDEATAPAGAEPRERVLALVQHGDVPAVGGEPLRDRRARRDRIR